MYVLLKEREQLATTMMSSCEQSRAMTQPSPHNELKWGKNSNFKCGFVWVVLARRLPERLKSTFFEKKILHSEAFSHIENF